MRKYLNKFGLNKKYVFLFYWPKIIPRLNVKKNPNAKLFIP